MISKAKRKNLMSSLKRVKFYGAPILQVDARGLAWNTYFKNTKYEKRHGLY